MALLPAGPRTVRVGDTRILTSTKLLRRLLDPYHFVLNLNWPQFFGGLLLVFVAVNLFFGTLFWLMPGSVTNARPGVFLDCFFFSVETLATVGYGVMSPATLGGHLVASAEILTGMVGVALVTGLVFARFSRPTARILFSDRAVIREFDGRRVLMLRMANERYNRIVQATATLSLVRRETQPDGESYVRFYDMLLERAYTPVFELTWTLIHPIDEHSPLHGRGAGELVQSRSRIRVSVAGHDETMAASVHAGKDYDAGDVVFGGRFVDILNDNPEGERIVDLTRFHDIQPGGDPGSAE